MHGVVGDGMVRKDVHVKQGDPLATRTANAVREEVRAPIVVLKHL